MVNRLVCVCSFPQSSVQFHVTSVVLWHDVGPLNGVAVHVTGSALPVSRSLQVAALMKCSSAPRLPIPSHSSVLSSGTVNSPISQQRTHGGQKSAPVRTSKELDLWRRVRSVRRSAPYWSPMLRGFEQDVCMVTRCVPPAEVIVHDVSESEMDRSNDAPCITTLAPPMRLPFLPKHETDAVWPVKVCPLAEALPSCGLDTVAGPPVYVRVSVDGL